MKTISIFVPEHAVMEAVGDPRYLFTTANNFFESSGRSAPFKVQMVGENREVKLQDGVFSVDTDEIIDEVQESDLIIIPAIFGDFKQVIEKNKRAIPWIRDLHKKGSEVASLCTGAFFLGATGLLDGKQCSTHWAYSDDFREWYPKAELVDGGVITDDDGVYSSGGANSYWNLLLYLLEKYTDRETAIMASKFFAIDIDRQSQASFMMFKGQKNHKDKEVLKAQEYIEENYEQRIMVDELAEQCTISRRSFERRFKSATNNTVLEYIQRVKIEAAKRCFELTTKNISEVMYEVGYSDTKAFRTVFKKITGLTPIEYRNKFYKEELHQELV